MAAFRELAALCETLTRTRSRLELARLVADFLGRLSPEEVRPAVRLLLGQAGRGETAVSGATLWPALVALAGDASAEDAWTGAVDFGEAVERLLSARGTAGPEPPALSLVEVETRVRALADARGPGSRAVKDRLLRTARPVEEFDSTGSRVGSEAGFSRLGGLKCEGHAAHGRVSSQEDSAVRKLLSARGKDPLLGLSGDRHRAVDACSRARGGERSVSAGGRPRSGPSTSRRGEFSRPD